MTQLVFPGLDPKALPPPAMPETEYRRVRGYTWDELSEAARKRAVQHVAKVLSTNWDPANDDTISDMFNEELRQAGLSSLEPYWSLGHSQGDGVAFCGYFSARDFKGDHQLVRKAKALAYRGLLVGIRVRNENRYYNRRSMTITAEVDFDNRGSTLSPLEQQAVDDLEAGFKEAIKELSGKLETMGYAEIEYCTGEGRATAILNGSEHGSPGFRFSATGRILVVEESYDWLLDVEQDEEDEC